MREFLKRNWLGLLGLFVGLIGILLSVIFYTRTLSSRDPVFVVDPNRTEIIKADRIVGAPLKIVRADGSEISGDITSVKVYLWNRGNISIKSEHILEPLKLTLGDPKGEILDFQILKISRKVVTPEVTRYAEDPARVLLVDFKILEQDDGFCLQIIYAGSSSTNFTIDGHIEGVPNHIGVSQLEESRFWVVYFRKLKMFGIFLIILAVGVGGILIFLSISEYLKKKAGKTFQFLKTCIEWSKLIVTIAIWLFMFIWIFILNPLKEAKKEARQSLVESIPSSIVPHQESIDTPNK